MLRFPVEDRTGIVQSGLCPLGRGAGRTGVVGLRRQWAVGVGTAYDRVISRMAS